MNSNLVFSCDWGTSRFRLRLVNADSYAFLSEITTDNGIAELNRQFISSGNSARETLYLSYLQKQIDQVNETGLNENTPVIISGMASSSIGLRELPYAPLPYNMSNEDAVVAVIPPSTVCKHPVFLVSGVSDGTEVMRGEETQVTGLYNHSMLQSRDEQLFILPGTHSKHIYVREGMIVRFQTYMTGEVFALLYKHSILSNSVSEPSGKAIGRHERDTFIEGVQASADKSLLNSIFSVRTNWLFEKFTKELNYYFLSGLVIGEELRNIAVTNQVLLLCPGERLQLLYKSALEFLGLKSQVIDAQTGEKAVVMGQIDIFKKVSTLKQVL